MAIAEHNKLVSFVISEDDYKTIKLIANKEDRSVSNVIKNMVLSKLKEEYKSNDKMGCIK